MDDKAAPGYEDESRVDGCLCDIEVNEGDTVFDTGLPPAAGGVLTAIEERGGEDGVDGCDVEFNGNDVTADGELPIAAGGIRPAEA